jgi:hypothetical protein
MEDQTTAAGETPTKHLVDEQVDQMEDEDDEGLQ